MSTLTKNAEIPFCLMVFVVGLCGVLLAGAEKAIGNSVPWWWPPTGGMRVEPANPTPSDVVIIILSGEWPDSCVPYDSAVLVSGTNIYFDAVAYYPPDVACLTMITPWELMESVGPLSAGTYTVYTRLIPGGGGYTQVGQFVVLRQLKREVIFVDADAKGANNGSSWTDAYNYLQDALTDASSAAKPVEIHVAHGTYRPDEDTLHPNGTGDRIATFHLISDVILKGSYAGFGTSDPNARDMAKYETILSGDLAGDDVDVADPCQLLREPSRAENSCHVLWGETNGTAVLDGFTITGGNANYGSNEHLWGGGLLNLSGSPVITNCKFTNNSASSIGGAMVMRPSGTVTNCIFNHNGVGGYGGAIWSDRGGSITVSNCTVAGNSSEHYTGGVYLMLAVSGYSSRENLHAQGAAVTLSQEGSLPPVITNCIFYANRDKNGMDEFAQVYLYPRDLYPQFRGAVIYSCIQGWTGSLGGIGNIDADPCFADPDNGDHHLKSQAGRWNPRTWSWVKDDVTSPCIDAGDPASPIGLESFPNGGIINMGAYGGTAEASKSYFGRPVCETIIAGDINGDCKVNLTDFAIMAFHWLEDRNP